MIESTIYENVNKLESRASSSDENNESQFLETENIFRNHNFNTYDYIQQKGMSS